MPCILLLTWTFHVGLNEEQNGQGLNRLIVLAKHFHVEPPFRYVQAPAIDANVRSKGEMVS